MIVTANVPGEPDQQVDIQILDGSERGNVYLSKKDVRGEARLAVTTHESADVGVCLTNRYTGCKFVLGGPRTQLEVIGGEFALIEVL